MKLEELFNKNPQFFINLFRNIDISLINMNTNKEAKITGFVFNENKLKLYFTNSIIEDEPKPKINPETFFDDLLKELEAVGFGKKFKM